MSVGYSTACGVGEGLYCWGSNSSGLLCDGIADHGDMCNGHDCSRIPIQVMVGGDVASVSVSAQAACAVTTTGEVWCWGDNGSGELGNGRQCTGKGCTNTPVKVLGVERASAVAVGFLSSACAIDAGVVKCWAANTCGQLGDGSTIGNSTPVRVDFRPSDGRSWTRRSVHPHRYCSGRRQ